MITYIIFVSLAAFILGLYYKIAWNPTYDLDTKLDKADLISRDKIISLGSLTLVNASETTDEVLF